MANGAVEGACFEMGFGWDEQVLPKQTKKGRALHKIKTLGECMQGDIVVVGGRELRVAWFWGVDSGVVGLYPEADGYVKRDCSNLVQLPRTAPCKAVRLRIGE